MPPPPQKKKFTERPLLLLQHQISDQRRYLRHFEEESEKLKTRMQEIEATLIQHSFEDTEPLWEQLRELQKQLELVLQRQRNTRTMVENLERRQAEVRGRSGREGGCLPQLC